MPSKLRGCDNKDLYAGNTLEQDYNLTYRTGL